MKKFFRNIVFKIPFLRRAGEKAALQLRGYAGAKVNRFTADWLTDYSTINRQIKNDVKAVRGRARDMWKNNPLIRAYRKRLLSDVIGPDGFKLQMRVEKADGTPDQKANDMIEQAWAEWMKKEHCTMSGTLTFTQVLWLLIEQYKRDGEFICRKVLADKEQNKFGFSLELIEPDLLDETYNDFKGENAIIMGIEFNQWKKPINYYFKEYDLNHEMTGVFAYTGHNSGNWNKVSADQIVHIFDPEHSNQFRGMSHLAPIMLEMRQLNGYDEAAVLAARLGASKNIFIKRDKDTELQGEETNERGDVVQYVSYGEAHYLNPGESLDSWNPTYPNAEYADFVKAIQRRLAVALGMSYNAWLSDLEGVNFSSMRSGLLTERDQWLIDQGFIIETFLEPIFSAWLKMALMTGAINLPYGDYERLNHPEFLGRRWQWVDPYKDVQASATAIENNLTTVTRELKKQGIDFDDFVVERKRELEMLTEAGISTVASIKHPDYVGDGGDEEVEDNEVANDNKSDRMMKEIMAVLKKHGNGHFKQLVK